MHLIVYTRKRLEPLVRKIPVIIPLAALALLPVLAGLSIYLQFEAAALRHQAAELGRQTALLEQRLDSLNSQLERLAAGPPPPTSPGALDILLDLRAPGGADPLFADAPAAAAASGGGVYALQVSSYRLRADAEQMAAALAEKIERKVLIQQAALASGRWYRVLIEPFAGRQDAAWFADSIRAAGVIGEYILQRLPDDWGNDPAYSEAPST